MTTSQDHTIKLIDVKQFEEVCMFESEHYLNGNSSSRSSISPSGDYAVIGSKNGNVIVLKLNNDSIQLEEIYSGEHESTPERGNPTAGRLRRLIVKAISSSGNSFR
eukprot:CAMPEP_0168323396 /NCGR_PEP_ID=MMETSP0213-20121227/3455_1 /TAXON_ID=151035 /ORGANISM="Euplotes harpa, Strain FSP1.4" /LENGTH=105 /DNA_ID=CAMNT_0008325457 /DNA_START=344 /DNA_END=657 /DNA_ORIENTATION=-